MKNNTPGEKYQFHSTVSSHTVSRLSFSFPCLYNFQEKEKHQDDTTVLASDMKKKETINISNKTVLLLVGCKTDGVIQWMYNWQIEVKHLSPLPTYYQYKNTAVCAIMLKKTYLLLHL